jgi:predicted transcriptional regulator
MSEMLSFREDDETITKIDELARQKMRSRSEIVRL